jgi:hypothetical protein
MLTKKQLKALGYSDITDYFDSIYSCFNDGDIEKVKDLIGDLGFTQRTDLKLWLLTGWQHQSKQVELKHLDTIAELTKLANNQE